MNLENREINKNHYTIIISVFLAIHILLGWHDINHPESFLSGDRSQSRMHDIDYVFSSDKEVSPPRRMLATDSKSESLLTNLIRIGDAGDYVYHGLIYSLGGPYLVIAVQLFLTLVATIFLYMLIVMLQQPSNIALLVTLIFIFLPGNLMQSHQLVTEAIYNPAIIVGIYFLVYCTQAEFRKEFMYFALIMFAFAITIKLQLILYPIILASIFLYFYRENRWKYATSIILICYVVPIGWIILNYIETSTIGLGPRDNNLSSEFFETAQRMANSGVDFDASIYPDHEMSLSEFLSFVRNHLLTYIRIEFSDFLNTYLNPGVNHFGGHYLGLLDAHDRFDYWKDIRDREGIIGVLIEIVRSGSAFTFAFFFVSLLWGLILIGSLIGAVLFIRTNEITTISKTIILSYIVYATVVLHAASNSRWTYRTHFEFVLILFFAIFLKWLVNRRSQISQHSQ